MAERRSYLLRIEAELLEEAKRIAAYEGRSVNAQLVQWTKEGIRHALSQEGRDDGAAGECGAGGMDMGEVSDILEGARGICGARRRD